MKHINDELKRLVNELDKASIQCVGRTDDVHIKKKNAFFYKRKNSRVA